MEATLSSSFLTSSLSNLATTTKRCRLSNPFLYNPISLPSSSLSLSSRKLGYKVRATVLKEKDEKVVVEESFAGKGSTVESEKGGGGVDAEMEGGGPGEVESWVVKFEHSVNILLTESVIKILDVLYRDRDYARFFVLETIARVPYFAFISVLHMYESFGWWRRADYLKVHFAESWNELHHLLIMEELGGNAYWFDRFLAQHIAIFYYFMTAFMYALSPRMAYHFSECVERHAYSTYDKFLKAQGDEFQTARTPNTRRPKIENLYDVFVNIREDEGEHCKTMKACQMHGNLRSPHSIVNCEEDNDAGCEVPEADCEGFADCVKKSLTSRG